MEVQPDLFTQDPYRGHAGYRRPQTSIDAAKVVTPTIKEAQRIVLNVLKREALTPDEVAARLGWDRLYVRPRCTELFNMGEVVRTGERRANRSRCSAFVLKAKGEPA